MSNQSKPAGPKVGSDDAQMTIEAKNNSLHTYLGGWRIKFSFHIFSIYTDNQAEFRF